MSINLRTVYAFAREMYPKKTNNRIEYGTAGFRGDAQYLDSVMFRMGVLATLRSRKLGGATIGVMITASHNPEPDNGVKLVDPAGEMLDASWEQLATDLVNVSDQELEKQVRQIISENAIDVNSSSLVFVGMDNRYHSRGLLKAAADGVLALKGKVTEFGIVTTPMLHYFVVAHNSRGAYGEPTEEGYYRKLIQAFESLRGDSLEHGSYRNELLFDGANGVGALKMLQFLKRMKNTLNVTVFNRGEGKINLNCGADYVKTAQTVPINTPKCAANTRCVSVDGDADRIVYYYTNEAGHFQLLDGDRIATLVAAYLKDMLKRCDLQLKMGLVQTAYANGGSTDYIQNQLKVAVACVPTGVKHLHHKAQEFDIGVYFEANGHGTIVFSENAKKTIAAAAETNADAKKLLHIISLINETVGDAISDMLLVETILKEKGWNVNEWQTTYDDLPNLQLKVRVQDRNVISTTNAERQCVTPPRLQEEIDKVVANYKRGRSFVRASGTEDVVRVYAEAANKQDADYLAYEVAQLVHQLAGGIGPEPAAPTIPKINAHM